MATTKIWDIRGRVDKLIRYVVNPEKTADLEYAAAMHSIENVIEYDADAMKTEEHLFVTGINCDENNAANEFMDAKKLLYFILKPFFGVETLSWMCMLGAAP